ncbi:hypothetical protein GF380_02085 [Candidatus Uhrbacteria bacterium]|nr:hypothetical protein [Candidatus Uhrbacteria bacterium]
MSTYKKSLTGGGHRLTPRDRKGRFARHAIECRVCGACGQIVLPEQKNDGSEAFPLLRIVYPERCPACDESL